MRSRVFNNPREASMANAGKVIIYYDPDSHLCKDGHLWCAERDGLVIGYGKKAQLLTDLGGDVVILRMSRDGRVSEVRP
jgi:hypothetical protein